MKKIIYEDGQTRFGNDNKKSFISHLQFFDYDSDDWQTAVQIRKSFYKRMEVLDRKKGKNIDSSSLPFLKQELEGVLTRMDREEIREIGIWRYESGDYDRVTSEKMMREDEESNKHSKPEVLEGYHEYDLCFLERVYYEYFYDDPAFRPELLTHSVDFLKECKFVLLD